MEIPNSSLSILSKLFRECCAVAVASSPDHSITLTVTVTEQKSVAEVFFAAATAKGLFTTRKLNWTVCCAVRDLEL